MGIFSGTAALTASIQVVSTILPVNICPKIGLILCGHTRHWPRLPLNFTHSHRGLLQDSKSRQERAITAPNRLCYRRNRKNCSVKLNL
ncbi:hypothetical protein CDAR_513091 [Caerostris darwini]|uniref:Secreted protein n=1 Tax=Caerostris darwini TaxID=1538125 RepID=A0AAV4W380_9ARAC|nr:hypothetical protein CDAR_513091 [Caerostris darwini]